MRGPSTDHTIIREGFVIPILKVIILQIVFIFLNSIFVVLDMNTTLLIKTLFIVNFYDKAS